MADVNCPCGTGKTYDCCCGRYHSGSMTPLTAEQLMRSRYVAVSRGLVDYLYDTFLPNKRAAFDHESTSAWLAQTTWLGLDVKATKAGGAKDQTGIVTFIARYLENGVISEHSETSQFRKRDGRWYYVKPL